MGGRWAVRTVADLQDAGALLVEDGNHGEYRPRPDEFCSEGTHFIRAADMDSGRVLFESAQRINEPARERIRKGIGAGGDVLLSHKGTVGKVAYVPEDAPPFVCSPQTTFWRVEDSNQLDRRYLYFFLLSRAFREQLDSRKGETDMADYVSLTTQRTLKVTVPPLPEQQAIAAVLGALDDKIELNRRMNATLEAMAGALFKSWFVDFDPVRAKLTGRKPERLDKETAALFPSTFQDSFLGKIPTGWTATTLGEACQSGGGDIQTGPFGSQLHAADYVPQGIPSIMPSDLRDNRIDATSIARIREEDAERLAAYRVRTGDIVYSRRGDVERRSLIRRGEDGWLCGTGCLRVRFGARGVDSHWGACHLGTAESREWVVRHAVGATMPNLNTSILGELPVLVPPSELQSLFGHIVGPWDERGTVALEESRTLATLRDTLLPQLLSGHLRVERE